MSSPRSASSALARTIRPAARFAVAFGVLKLLTVGLFFLVRTYNAREMQQGAKTP